MSRSRKQALDDGRALRSSDSGGDGVRQTEPERGDDSPRPGDLWVMPELGDWPELWAVLEVSLPGRVRLVPADLDPRCGSRDVGVPPQARCGALTLRVRHATWCRHERLAGGLLAGQLEAVDLERLRERAAGLETGEEFVDDELHLTDDDPEYRRLSAELRSVCDRIEDELPSTGPGPKGMGAAAVVSGRVRPRPWVLWGSACLALVAGFIGGWLGRGQVVSSDTKLADASFSSPLRLTSETLTRGHGSVPGLALDADFVHLTLEIPEIEPESGVYSFRVVAEHGEGVGAIPYEGEIDVTDTVEIHLHVPSSALRVGTHRLEVHHLEKPDKTWTYRFRVGR